MYMRLSIWLTCCSVASEATNSRYPFWLAANVWLYQLEFLHRTEALHFKTSGQTENCDIGKCNRSLRAVQC